MADQDDRYLEAKRRVETRLGFLIHAAVFAVVNLVFLLIVGWDWLWVTVFWGIGLAVQAFTTFGATSQWARDWKQRAIHKELTRGEGEPEGPPTQPMTPPS
jgi:hypothetical protein